MNILSAFINSNGYFVLKNSFKDILYEDLDKILMWYKSFKGFLNTYFLFTTPNQLINTLTSQLVYIE